MTIERIKFENGKIGVYRRCKKTLGSKIPNIEHLSSYERFWFLKHFYTDFANNTNRAYEKTYFIDRETIINGALAFTALVFMYNLIIADNTEYAVYGLFAGLILMVICIFTPLPRGSDPRDAFFKMNDVEDWRLFEQEYKETGKYIPADTVAILALQVSEEEYKYLKAIDALDGRWYEGLIELESLKKALEYAANFAKVKQLSEKPANKKKEKK